MAGVDLIGGRAHPLRHEAFEVRLDRAVLVGHDVSTRLRLPGGAFNLLVEQVCRRRRVGRLDEVLLLPRQVSRKARDACRSHPEAPIRHFDVGKDVCERELGLLTLRRLVGVRRECSDVDEPSNAGIGPGSRDDCAAVRVADEDDRADNPPQCAFYCDNVACECVEAVLGSDRFVPLCLKAGISLLKDEPSAQIPWAKTCSVCSAWTWCAPLVGIRNDFSAVGPGSGSNVDVNKPISFQLDLL
jgi:hypothetical protein